MITGKGLDRFDRAILEILQQDNKTPQRVIAEQVGLSAPAVQRRVKRMEEDGVIMANVSIVNPDSVHQQITVIVGVEMTSEIGEHHDDAKETFLSCKEIQQIYYVTGDIDFLLIVVLGSMAEYESLTRRIFFGNNNVKRFKSYVVMDRVKAELGIRVNA